jgi:lauroyl/myristoyl acyltransferase
MLRILDFYKFKKQNFETIMHDKHSASVAFCSANINVFLPQIDVKRYSKIILRIFYNNDLAKREKTNLKNLNKIDYSSLKLPYNKGFFLVSFHYGSYHLISSMLIKLNYKTVVCVNETVFQNKQTIEDSLNTFKKFKNEVSSESDLVFLSVQDEAFVFNVKEYLEKNYAVLVFIDGNSGLDGIMNFDSKKKTDVDFFNQTIKVKYGIPSLAYSFNVPIIPVFSIRKRNSYLIKSCNIIDVDKSLNKEAFSIYAIKKIYSELESQLKVNPFQWEGWLYVHRWLDITNLKDISSVKIGSEKKVTNLKFNNQKFAYFKLKESHFLLNKYTHLSYEIDEKIKEIIFSNKKNKFESRLIEDCIENNILI